MQAVRRDQAGAVLRVLKPGGRLMVAESYKVPHHDLMLGAVMKLLGSPRLNMDAHRARLLATDMRA